MKLTWLDANSWLIETGNAQGKTRILVDPWLVGDLVFGNAPWLIKGVKPEPSELPTEIDLILISQGLADHAHPETLKQLDKSIPVVASSDGADVAKQLGYKRVTAVGHGDTYTGEGIGEGVTIQTFAGAVVGPAKRENAYVVTFTEGTSRTRLYYEPHGYPDIERLTDLGKVDVVITPMADITLMGIAPVIRGAGVAPKLAEMLKPQVMLPTAEAGRASYEGLLAGVLKMTGGAAELRASVEAAGEGTQVVQPVSGETIELILQEKLAV